MALPIAHATAGYVLYRLDRRSTPFRGWQRALTYMVVANLPDLDFLVGFVVGRPGVFHRGVSHTLVAAVVFGAAMAFVTRCWWRERWLRASVVYAAVYASHCLVDMVTVDARGPEGMQLLWPFSDAYVHAPFSIFHEILVDGRTRLGFLATVFTQDAVWVLARDVAIAAGVVLGLHLVETGARRLARWRLPVATGDSEEDGA